MIRLLSGLLAIAICGPCGVLMADDAPQPAIAVSGQTITFTFGERLVGRYHGDPDLPQPHFHPLLAPNGKPLTRAFPMEKGVPGETTDHPHHRAAWFCHGDVIADGLEGLGKRGITGHDFWSVGTGHGRIACTRMEAPHQEKGLASVVTTNEWLTPAGEKVLDETRTFTLTPRGGGWLLVVDVELQARSFPVTFGDTKEGAFAVRVNDAMAEQRKAGGTLENAEGKNGEKACWGQFSAWCDYSGPVEGETIGLAIFDHPRNPSPACWHARAYGLMAANPFGRAKSGFPATKEAANLVKIPKGERLRFRYALFGHLGDAKAGQVAEAHASFLQLP